MMKSIELKINNDAKLLKPLFKRYVTILISSLSALIFFTFIDLIINIIYIFNKSISNYLVLFFSAFFIILLLGFSIIFFNNLIKKNYFVTRNYLLIWIMLGILAIFIALLIYRITTISSTKNNDLTILNNLAYDQPWHNRNENSTIYILHIQYINASILFYESIVYLVIFIVSFLLIFIYSNKLYGAANLLYYHGKMKYFEIDFKNNQDKNINNNLASSKQLYVLNKYGIKYKENITKRDASNIISNLYSNKIK